MLSIDELQPARTKDEALDSIVRRSRSLGRRRVVMAAAPVAVVAALVVGAVLPGGGQRSVSIAPADGGGSGVVLDGQAGPASSPTGAGVGAAEAPGRRQNSKTSSANAGVPLVTTTTAPQPAIQPALTNDPIVFADGYSQSGAIWIMDADGTNRRTVVKRPYAASPALSPDRRTVAFAAPVDDSYTRNGVWTVPAAGGTPRLVIESSAWSVWSVDWSPDGGSLAYGVADPQQVFGVGGVNQANPADPTHDIRTVRLDGTGDRLVVEQASYPRWSPDGSKIAFFRVSEGIGTVAPDGTGLRMLGGGTDPAWSPDGRFLAFTGNGTVFIMDADGANERVLLGGHNFTPSWSSDGKAIAFSFSEGGAYGIAVIRPDGTGYRKVAVGGGMAWPRFPGRRHG